MTKWTETIERYLAEGRTVSGGKHEDEKAKADAAQQRNQAMQDKAFQQQMDTLGSLKTSLGKYITGNVGLDPEQLALTKSQFLNSNSKQFNAARQNVLSSMLSRGSGGGTGPVGGDFVKGLSGLYGAGASSLSSGLSNINIQNLQQALNNKFNAAGVLSGNAATLSNPVSTFGAGANQALDERIKVGLTPGFGQALLTSFAGGLGGGLSSALTGGIGKAISGVGGGGVDGR